MRRLYQLFKKIWVVSVSARTKRTDFISEMRGRLREEALANAGLYVRPILGKLVSNSTGEAEALINEAIANILITRSVSPNVTAVFRIKNAATFLALSVSSYILLCSKIVIVDNDSSDDSLAIAEKLKQDFKHVCDISIFSYPGNLAKYGIGYLEAIRRNPEQSLAAYYNFAFSKAHTDYVFKADAHTLLLPFGVLEIQKKTAALFDIIYVTGVETYGRTMDFEPRIYRRDPRLCYEDGEFWEYLSPKDGSLTEFGTGTSIAEPLFLHLKAFQFVKDSYPPMNPRY